MPDVFLKVGYKNHENGSLNNKAQFGQRIATIMLISTCVLCSLA